MVLHAFLADIEFSCKKKRGDASWRCYSPFSISPVNHQTRALLVDLAKPILVVNAFVTLFLNGSLARDGTLGKKRLARRSRYSL